MSSADRSEVVVTTGPSSGVGRATAHEFDDEAEAGSVHLRLTKHCEAIGALRGVLALAAATLHVGDDG